MEPMTCSPPSSPASPGIYPNFLPNFLMGGDTQPSPPNPSTSPGRPRGSGTFNKMPSSVMESRGIRPKLFDQPMTSPMSPKIFSPLSEKQGPPKTGLFDSLEQEKKPSSPIMSSTVAHLNESVDFNESVSRIHEDSLNYSRNTSFANLMNRTNSNATRIDTNWVTVYGFPPSCLTQVLSHLANCGPIIEKKVTPQGNWVHVKFSAPNEVSRALALNGKMINSNIMIGVKLHYVSGEEGNENAVFTSPIRARNLRHSFVSPQNSNSVVTSQTLPQKSTGVLTKAMEYVFGW